MQLTVTIELSNKTLSSLLETAMHQDKSLEDCIQTILSENFEGKAPLSREERIKRIREGLKRSGYKPNGKKANVAKHTRIKELAALGIFTASQIAHEVGCGPATVYRVLKA